MPITCSYNQPQTEYSVFESAIVAPITQANSVPRLFENHIFKTILTQNFDVKDFYAQTDCCINYLNLESHQMVRKNNQADWAEKNLEI